SGKRERHDQARQHPQRPSTIEPEGLFILSRHPFEEPSKQEDRERKVGGRVDKYQSGQRVEQTEPVHQQELRDDELEAGHGKTSQEEIEDDLFQGELVSGESEGGQRGEGQGK